MTTNISISVETLKNNIQSSAAWAARAIWFLANVEITNLMQYVDDPSPNGKELCYEFLKISKEYFEEMKEFYKSNNYFSNRQLFLARKRINSAHYEFLKSYINSKNS